MYNLSLVGLPNVSGAPPETDALKLAAEPVVDHDTHDTIDVSRMENPKQR